MKKTCNFCGIAYFIINAFNASYLRKLLCLNDEVHIYCAK